MLRKRQDVSGPAVFREEWNQEIRRIRDLLAQNELLFNMTCDDDLTDYAIFERNALLTRYRYLLRQIRAADSTQEIPAVKTARV